MVTELVSKELNPCLCGSKQPALNHHTLEPPGQGGAWWGMDYNLAPGGPSQPGTFETQHCLHSRGSAASAN